tara:strand:- start:377 stop:649 length:273 start_codon:yes stop_codon:yes gene_type:complete
MKNFYLIQNNLFNYYFLSKNLFYFSISKFFNKKTIDEIKFFMKSSKLKNQKLNLICREKINLLSKEKKIIKKKIIFNYRLFNLKKNLTNF